MDGVSIWWSVNCTDPSLNLVQRNVSQSNVTEPNEGNVVTVTVFDNKEKYRSCTWRSVLPPNHPTDSSSHICLINSVCHWQKKKKTTHRVFMRKKKSLRQGRHWRNPLETHTRHHHDVYRHVSLGAAASDFCVNCAAVHLYSGVLLCVNEQRQRIGKRPLRC